MSPENFLPNNFSDDQKKALTSLRTLIQEGKFGTGDMALETPNNLTNSSPNHPQDNVAAYNFDTQHIPILSQEQNLTLFTSFAEDWSGINNASLLREADKKPYKRNQFELELDAAKTSTVTADILHVHGHNDRISFLVQSQSPVIEKWTVFPLFSEDSPNDFLGFIIDSNGSEALRILISPLRDATYDSWERERIAKVGKCLNRLHRQLA